MHIRVKFGKYGTMKFIGHLDTMRYFQKAIKRAGLDIKYSGGYSPHMIMSFASPLGVGVTSDGEYFDIEMNSSLSSAESVEKLNEAMADGMKVYSYREIPGDKKNKGMTLVAAADYQVTFRDEDKLPADWEKRFIEYCAQPSITVVKKTKKSEKEVDIKPFLYEYKTADGKMFMKLAAGSVNNIKPNIVIDGFAKYLNITPGPFPYLVHRIEMYGNGKEENTFISLEDLGEEVE